MSIRRLVAAGALAAAALVTVNPVASIAHDPHCDSEIVVDAGGFYVDNRGTDHGGIWLYQETNGIAGLQRGGDNVWTADDGCVDIDPATGEPYATPDELLV